MNLEELNELCSRIMKFYNYTLENQGLYTYELFNKLNEDQIANLLVAKSMISKSIIKKINGDYDKYSDIFNYCIVFKEDLIDNELLLYLINNNMNDSFNVLMMNKKLNDEIVLSVLDNTDLNESFTGKKPFDYRYHILKRIEISDDVKNNILKTYDEEELEKTIDQIYLDLQDEFSLNGIFDDEELNKYPDIQKEYIAFNTMVKYSKQKVYKK